MKKLLSAVGAAALFTNVAIAPAFADSLEPQTELNAEYQMVLPEGEIMSDAELAEIEGELVWKPILISAGIGAAQGFAGTTYSCYTIPGARCGWKQYAGGAAGGAARRLFFRR